MYHDGFSLQFRAGEVTEGCGSELLCPNQFCPPKNFAGQKKARDDPVLTADVQQLLEQRHAERMAATVSKATSECVAGPVAYGFDRPGGGGTYDSMKLPGGTKCSGVAMLNSTGCSASVSYPNALMISDSFGQLPSACRDAAWCLLHECMLLTQMRRRALPCAAKTRSVLALSMVSLLDVTRRPRKIVMLSAVG